MRDLGRALSVSWDKAVGVLPIEFPRLGTLRNSPDPELSERIKEVWNACKDEAKGYAELMPAPSEKLMRELRETAPAMRALIALTFDFDRAYAAEKRRRSEVDFADLEHMTVRLLTDPDGSPSPTALAVGRRFREIMVDEYQDVNGVQDTIFRALSSEGKNLFMVGDVKQSIYRFRLADSFATGNVIKNGLPVAIVGETNAGKSTLLNYLLRDDRALVSDIHGTTRDVIEDTITLGGTLFRFIDTAGIRQTSDAIENLGIERAFQKIDQAQIVIWLIDTSAPIEQIDTLAEQILPRSADKKIIAAINKIDIADPSRIQAIEDHIRQLAPQAAIAHISAKNGINVEQLETLIARTAQGDYAQSDIVITNARHYEALTLAAQSIERAIDGLRSGISGDFVAQDIRETIHHLSSITGEITTDQILGTIFSRFCIGK